MGCKTHLPFVEGENWRWETLSVKHPWGLLLQFWGNEQVEDLFSIEACLFSFRSWHQLCWQRYIPVPLLTHTEAATLAGKHYGACQLFPRAALPAPKPWMLLSRKTFLLGKCTSISGSDKLPGGFQVTSRQSQTPTVESTSSNLAKPYSDHEDAVGIVDCTLS